MCRIQEFYESNHANIRGKVFSLEDFIATYYADGNKESYFDVWEGFNVPKSAIDEFFGLHLKPMDYRRIITTSREYEIARLWIGSDYQYLIATQEGGAPDVLAHELHHARYSMDDNFRRECKLILLSMPEEIYSSIRLVLLDEGYPDDDNIMADEISAYLRTSLKKELKKMFRNVPIDLMFYLTPYIDQLKAIA